MRIFLVNPSDIAFGVGVITPRWLYVIAAATPEEFGTPRLVDETLEPLELERVEAGDLVGIGIHTGNALRGFALGRAARQRGAIVVYGGIHATLYPDEVAEHGAAHAVISGDGDLIWAQVLRDAAAGLLQTRYDGGRVPGPSHQPARWDLLPPDKYMWASVQTERGCPKHCSFCSVWRTDGQQPRQRESNAVIEEIVTLRRLGYRFIALADDNFYPVSKTDLALAAKQNNSARLAELTRLRQARFDFMHQLALLPADTVLYTQITMEAAEDPEFLAAMRKAHILGALVGVEAVTPEGLKTIYKDFNLVGDALVDRLKLFREHGVHVLGSFIFGLSSDRASTFPATVALAKRANLTFAQFVMMTPFPGTVDFERWEKEIAATAPRVDGIPITRYWLIPAHRRPKMFMPHPTMTSDEIRFHTQAAWDDYYSLGEIWKRSSCVKSLKARMAFVLVSKLYRQMYANTGISSDSGRRDRANRWARLTGRLCLRLFRAKPMPHLAMPEITIAAPAAGD